MSARGLTGWPLLLPAILAATVPTLAVAQDRLVNVRTVALSVAYETWSFSDGVPQPTEQDQADVLVERASQVTFPLTASVPVSEAWTIDLATAYASGSVNLRDADPELGLDQYSLSGFSDTRLRATGRLSPTVAVTLGLNLPTGLASLSPEEYNAFRVLGAPALSLQVARLGNGISGTAGVVLSRQLGEQWSGAVGVSYEMRGSYDPGTLVPQVSEVDYSPGDALRFSLALDGLLGQHGMTLGLSADFYPNPDRLSSSGAEGTDLLSTQLGPVLSADWQLRLAADAFRELTFYVLDRYRTEYGTGLGDGPVLAVGETSGNYLDAGVRGVVPSGRLTSLLAAVNFRHQTGLEADRTFATAGMMSGALTLGLARTLGNGYSIQPFVRGQLGRIKTADEWMSATGIAGGITFGRQF